LNAVLHFGIFFQRIAALATAAANGGDQSGDRDRQRFADPATDILGHARSGSPDHSAYGVPP
jgi:hypothetical protein